MTTGSLLSPFRAQLYEDAAMNAEQDRPYVCNAPGCTQVSNAAEIKLKTTYIIQQEFETSSYVWAFVSLLMIYPLPIVLTYSDGNSKEKSLLKALCISHLFEQSDDNYYAIC